MKQWLTGAFCIAVLILLTWIALELRRIPGGMSYATEEAIRSIRIDTEANRKTLDEIARNTLRR